MRVFSALVIRLFGFLLVWTFQFCEGNSCGGFLEANEGILQYSDQNENSVTPCIWTIRLHSKSDFELELNSLDEHDTDTWIGLYNRELALVPFPIIQPSFVFNATTIGIKIRPQGQVMILILRSSIKNRGFELSWKGLSSESESTESSNYLDSELGEITESSEGSQFTAFILAPSIEYNFDVYAKIIDYESDCANLAYSIYEITNAGFLREIARTCGRPVSLENLSPPLIALVVKPTKFGTEVINLKWWPHLATTTTTTTTTTEISTIETDAPIITTIQTDEPIITTIQTDAPIITTEPPGSGDSCGGILVDRGVVRYKVNEDYDSGEHCVWILQLSNEWGGHGAARVQMLQDGFIQDEAYLTILWTTRVDINQAPFSTNTYIQAGNHSGITLSGPLLILTFISNKAGGQGFELDFFGYGSPWNRKMTSFHFKESQGFLNYPGNGNLYRTYEIVAIVIDPEALNEREGIELWLEYMDIESSTLCRADVLEIHRLNNTITELADYSLTGRFCDRDWHGPAIGFVSWDEPFVLIFRTDDSTQYYGFNITWNLFSE